MKQLLETFIAQDITGNQYRIERYQVIKKAGTKLIRGQPFLLHKGTPVSDMGDDLYYIPALDTEVARIS